ncbi:GTPase domain-containing protein [Sphingomonas sp. CD22]|uniref:GTPase domain-containing protein n=1 Tax=Sphingomonas sp. CD22 TaxID=3100214 RepID=UPI002AE0A982|nr:GTPase domain-containing protein [Sphingomonas sp. CD22]MEA1083252.1 GTPase domain-containing protein [Sphingomonas sp. CD22]
MPIDEAWSEIVPKFIRVPLLAYKYRNFIRTWAYRGLVALGWGRTDVVVVGRAGAGKSVLMERLSGQIGDVNWQPPHLSTKVESAVLNLGQRPLLIRTIPGQDSRERANGLHEALNRHKKLQGIIYVADWGYNAERQSAVAADRITREGIDTIDKLREFNLEAELRDFRDIVQRMKDAHSRTGGSFWLMVIVNKADLFFDRLDAAQTYYHHATPAGFADAVDDLVKRIGGNRFRYESLPVSSWHEEFIWNGQTQESRLNDSQTRALFAHMRDRINHLSDWWNS